MATIRVDSAATGLGDGTSWTDAYPVFGTAVAAASAGDTILVDDGHSETLVVTTTTYTFAGTILNPVYVWCVDKADDSLSTGATITTDTGTRDVELIGSVCVYGMTFNWTRNFKTAHGASNRCVLDTCTIALTSGASAGTRQWALTSQGGNDWTILECLNCTIDLDTDGNGTSELGWNRGFATFKNCNIQVNSTASAIFESGMGAYLYCEGCDFSSSSETVLYRVGDGFGRATFEKCRLPTSWSVAETDFDNCPETVVIVSNCEDGTITDPALGVTGYYRGDVGNIVTDLARYRTGGADDGEQANAYSWAMTTTANTIEAILPLESPPLVLWVDPDATPSGATAQGLFQSTRMAPQGTPAALTTDSGSTWTGTGVGTKQKISVTVGDYTLTMYVASGVTLNDDDLWVEVSAPDQVGGPLIVRFFLAKPSTTVYVDPLLDVTDHTTGRQYFVAGVQIMDGYSAAAGGGGLIIHPGMAGGFNG